MLQSIIAPPSSGPATQKGFPLSPQVTMSVARLSAPRALSEPCCQTVLVVTQASARARFVSAKASVGVLADHCTATVLTICDPLSSSVRSADCQQPHNIRVRLQRGLLV